MVTRLLPAASAPRGPGHGRLRSRVRGTAGRRLGAITCSLSAEPIEAVTKSDIATNLCGTRRSKALSSDPAHRVALSMPGARGCTYQSKIRLQPPSVSQVYQSPLYVRNFRLQVSPPTPQHFQHQVRTRFSNIQSLLGTLRTTEWALYNERSVNICRYPLHGCSTSLSSFSIGGLLQRISSHRIFYQQRAFLPLIASFNYHHVACCVGMWASRRSLQAVCSCRICQDLVSCTTNTFLWELNRYIKSIRIAF